MAVNLTPELEQLVENGSTPMSAIQLHELRSRTRRRC